MDNLCRFPRAEETNFDYIYLEHNSTILTVLWNILCSLSTFQIHWGSTSVRICLAYNPCHQMQPSYNLGNYCMYYPLEVFICMLSILAFHKPYCHRVEFVHNHYKLRISHFEAVWTYYHMWARCNSCRLQIPIHNLDRFNSFHRASVFTWARKGQDRTLCHHLEFSDMADSPSTYHQPKALAFLGTAPKCTLYDHWLLWYADHTSHKCHRSGASASHCTCQQRMTCHRQFSECTTGSWYKSRLLANITANYTSLKRIGNHLPKLWCNRDIACTYRFKAVAHYNCSSQGRTIFLFPSCAWREDNLDTCHLWLAFTGSRKGPICILSLDPDAS